MGEPTKRATLNIYQATKERMAERMRYGDTPDEFINKLLDLADKYQPLQKPQTLEVKQEATNEQQPNNSNGQ